MYLTVLKDTTCTYGELSIYVENLGTIFRQMEQWVWKKQLLILGNKPRISTRSMVRECDRGKWFSNIPVISVKTGKEDYMYV